MFSTEQIHNLVIIAKRIHLFPFRTQKLSSLAPMVLGGKPPGRVKTEEAVTIKDTLLLTLKPQNCVLRTHQAMWTQETDMTQMVSFQE